MGRYILRRLLTMIPVLLVISIAVFLLMSLVLGDPTLLLMGSDTGVSQQTIQEVRQSLGLNRPLPVRYVDWLGQLARGDLGRSWRTPASVSSIVLRRVPVTLELSALALVIAIAVGVPLGIAAALRPGSRLDLSASTFTVISLSIPNFFLGIVLIFLFALKLRLLPSAGYVSLTKDPPENLKLMILPAFTLAAANMGNLARYTRSMMIEVLAQDYVRTARSKGLRSNTVVVRHALKNSLIPVATVLGLQVAGLFGGAVVTETVFSLPGIGTLLTESIFGRDLPVVQGVILLITVAVLFTNVLVDLVYGYLDPRVRLA